MNRAREEIDALSLSESELSTSDGAGPDTVAAVDLGSNSFHMVIARRMEPELRILDRVRERVQLAAGLDARKHLSDEAQARALDCLRRMGQRLRDFGPERVRAVGTNTLRRAKNARSFLLEAQEALGHPVEIVSGQEEARLIYLGVAHSLADDPGHRLVVDIGGGSTEVIIGEGFDVLEADSLHMGCVSYSMRFFPDGELRRDVMRRAELAARVELQTLERRFRRLGWATCVGASGTVEAVSDVLRANGWDEQGAGITAGGLRKLRKAVVAAGHRDALALPGLKPERAPVLPGGLAILEAVFSSLKIERMVPAGGALREGLLYDLVGRIRREDVRDRTIRRFEERYHVDLEQAARVEDTARYLLEQVGPHWALDLPQAAQALTWASRLHEVGLVVAYSSYHKHGAYLVQHSFMPGFSNDEQQVLAALVRLHRRKLTGFEVPDVPPLGADRILCLAVLLRLAVLLNRARSVVPLPPVTVGVKAQRLRLSFPKGWLDEHPLTQADLEVEQGLLKAKGIKLQVR